MDAGKSITEFQNTVIKKMNNFESEINNIKRELLSFDNESQFTESNQSQTQCLELMDKGYSNVIEQYEAS